MYRADRMIQSGGWSKMRSADEHTKLARVAIEFWPEFDSAFRLSVSKTFVVLPDDLREQLASRVERLTRRARGCTTDQETGGIRVGERGGAADGRGRAALPSPRASEPTCDWQGSGRGGQGGR